MVKFEMIQRAGVPPRSHDDELCAAVSAGLSCSSNGNFRDVRVAACSGHVYLSGKVSTYHAKQSAQQAAMSVAGVERVHNYLVVES
jgi:osmotically-inducible protein OsmY